MRAGPLFGTSSQPIRATIGAGLKPPSRACWPGCWSMLGGSGSRHHTPSRTADAITSPAGLVERLGADGMPSDQVRKLLARAARMAAALGGSPGERAKLVRELVDKIIVDEKTIIIKLRRGLLLGDDVASSASEAANGSAVELTAAAAFTR